MPVVGKTLNILVNGQIFKIELNNQKEERKENRRPPLIPQKREKKVRIAEWWETALGSTDSDSYSSKFNLFGNVEVPPAAGIASPEDEAIENPRGMDPSSQEIYDCFRLWKQTESLAGEDADVPRPMPNAKPSGFGRASQAVRTSRRPFSPPGQQEPLSPIERPEKTAASPDLITSTPREDAPCSESVKMLTEECPIPRKIKTKPDHFGREAETFRNPGRRPSDEQLHMQDRQDFEKQSHQMKIHHEGRLSEKLGDTALSNLRPDVPNSWGVEVDRNMHPESKSMRSRQSPRKSPDRHIRAQNPAAAQYHERRKKEKKKVSPRLRRKAYVDPDECYCCSFFEGGCPVCNSTKETKKQELDPLDHRAKCKSCPCPLDREENAACDIQQNY